MPGSMEHLACYFSDIAMAGSMKGQADFAELYPKKQALFKSVSEQLLEGPILV